MSAIHIYDIILVNLLYLRQLSLTAFCEVHLQPQDIDLHPEHLSIKWDCDGVDNQFQIILQLVSTPKCDVVDDTSNSIYGYRSPWIQRSDGNTRYHINLTNTDIYANSTYQVSVQSRVQPLAGAEFIYGVQKSVNVTTNDGKCLSIRIFKF